MNAKSVSLAVVAGVSVVLLGLIGSGCSRNRDSQGQDLSAPASQPKNAYGGGKPAGGGAPGTNTPPGPAGGR